MSNQYIDINKGFRRLGNFPAFDNEVFSTFNEAKEYALSGKNGGSAYVGQLIKVLPATINDNPTIYIINNNYELQSTTENILENSNLAMPFAYGAENSIQKVLPAGFVISNITIKIIDGFANSNAVNVYLIPYSEINTDGELIISSNITNEDRNYIITNESGTDFNFAMTRVINEPTIISIRVNSIISDVTRSGSGILKIN